MKFARSLAFVPAVILAACQSYNPNYERLRIPDLYIVKSFTGKTAEKHAPQPTLPKQPSQPEPAKQPAPKDIKPAHPSQAPPAKPPEKRHEEKDLNEIVYGHPEIKAVPVAINNVNSLALEIQGYSGEQLYAVKLVNGGEEYWVGTAGKISQYDSKDEDGRKIRGAMGIGSNIRLKVAKPVLMCNGNIIDISELELIVDNEKR